MKIPVSRKHSDQGFMKRAGKRREEHYNRVCRLCRDWAAQRAGHDRHQRPIAAGAIFCSAPRQVKPLFRVLWLSGKTHSCVHPTTNAQCQEREINPKDAE